MVFQFGLLASYAYYFKNEANLVYKASDGIFCDWNTTNKEKATLRSGESSILTCKRNNFRKSGYVIVHRIDGSGDLSLPWKAKPSPKPLISSIFIEPKAPKKVKISYSYGEGLKGYERNKGEKWVSTSSEYTIYNHEGGGAHGNDIAKCLVTEKGLVQAYNKDSASQHAQIGDAVKKSCSTAKYDRYTTECCRIN